jgi:hypothetical protein
MTTKAPPTTTPGCELHAIDFLAHQLYMQSLNGGIGVLWLTMREDLQEKWRTQAAKLFDDWHQHELERLHSRQEIDDEIAGLVSRKLPQ